MVGISIRANNIKKIRESTFAQETVFVGISYAYIRQLTRHPMCKSPSKSNVLSRCS